MNQIVKTFIFMGIAAGLILTGGSVAAQPLPENSPACARGCGVRGPADDLERHKMVRSTNYYNRGLKFLNRGDYKKAAKQFDRASAQQPANGYIRYMSGSSYYLAGNFDRAKPRLEKALAIDGDNALGQKQQAIARNMLKQMATQ